MAPDVTCCLLVFAPQADPTEAQQADPTDAHFQEELGAEGAVNTTSGCNQRTPHCGNSILNGFLGQEHEEQKNNNKEGENV